MCRFVAYLGPAIPMSSLITEPRNSLIHQSYHARERTEPLNGDGFGVAWYEPHLSSRPALFRSVSPAWSNANLREVARMTVSPCIFGHVRAASRPLSVTEFNCHPFVDGPYAFMHNGDIEAFERIRRALLERLSDEAFAAIRGTTDSEHLFALFLDEMRRRAAAEEPGEAMADALTAAVRTCVELSRQHGVDGDCYLNLAVTDGTFLVATRFTTAADTPPSSLHVHVGCRYTCEEGLCRMLAADEGVGAIIVSSEILSEDPGWQTVPANHLVLARAGTSLTMRPLTLT